MTGYGYILRLMPIKYGTFKGAPLLIYGAIVDAFHRLIGFIGSRRCRLIGELNHFYDATPPR